MHHIITSNLKSLGLSINVVCVCWTCLVRDALRGRYIIVRRLGNTCWRSEQSGRLRPLVCCEPAEVCMDTTAGQTPDASWFFILASCLHTRNYCDKRPIPYKGFLLKTRTLKHQCIAVPRRGRTARQAVVRVDGYVRRDGYGDLQSKLQASSRTLDAQFITNMYYNGAFFFFLYLYPP